MLRLLWEMTRGYRLRPWRSPYLRWRIETYQGMHADRIGFRDFWRFTWRERRELFRYLRWAAGMRRAAARPAASREIIGPNARF
jgi:hypothetical protein